MNKQELALALRDRHNFLCGAWERGMCDASEVEEAHRALRAAEAELAKEPT